jgi:hypothetical protein
VKNINYLNKSFDDIKLELESYAKSYFPNTYNDFSDSNPGAMFIEMVSYVGDVLSFYVDTQIQENVLLHAKEKENLMNMAYSLGYRPKVSYASSTTVDIYQPIKTKTDGSMQIVDTDYGLIIPEKTVITNTSNITFLTTKEVNFSNTSSMDITPYSANNSYFLAKKSVPVISGEIITKDITFGNVEKFSSKILEDDNILQIIDVYDSDGNKWYEVPYLAQESLLENVYNNADNNPSFNENDNVDSYLNIRSIPRRFTSRFKSNNTLELQFGSGTSNKDDEKLVPNVTNLGLGLISGISDLDSDFNKASPLFSKSYGIAPSNTTLTVRYLKGGGLASNSPSNTLINIDTTSVYFNGNVSDSEITDNVVVTNPLPSTGGRDGDNVEEIRLNTLNSFQSQLRAVTSSDYIIRTLSLPAEYGNIAKVNIIKESSLGDKNNPFSINMYILAYDLSKNLTTATPTLKTNLKKYLNEYRILTDAINIRDAYVINIGVDFTITLYSGYNGKSIIEECITSLKNFFSIDKWQINEPISISDIYKLLLEIEGVKNVQEILISNKYGGTYSEYSYDIKGATKNNVIYPSKDPCIFEVKLPNQDIKGRISS